MDKWENFYRPYFDSEKELKKFISTCEYLELEDERHRAK